VKRLTLFVFLLLSVITILAGCSSEKPLLIWVGSESEAFYTQKMNDYVALYNASHEEKFPYKVAVKAVDTASAGATFLDDTEAGADIFTVPHDHLGRLIAGASSIAPVQSAELLAQIEANTPEIFFDYIKGTVLETEYTFGIPIIAQALILYYNKSLITETQVQTWEGILEAAVAANKQALSLAGADGFNNSFLLLARNAQTLESTVRIYADGTLQDCFASGDDTVAIMKWGQRFFTNPNGAKPPSESGWEIELKDGISISMIGGAWQFQAAQRALGSNLGVAKLPTFTLTSADAYGTAEAGTVFQSGTFYDTKMFVMKKNSPRAAYLEDILLYLSSIEVQEESFDQAANLPIYKNAVTEFSGFTGDTVSANLANAQVDMFQFGIPQPFGKQSAFNIYYYSKGAPDLIMEILRNTGGNYTTHAQIKAKLEVIETIWKTGAQN
jgi:arabinogalactan oligomer/maltooligosaccharide transport system substrate-binding protein